MDGLNYGKSFQFYVRVIVFSALLNYQKSKLKEILAPSSRKESLALWKGCFDVRKSQLSSTNKPDLSLRDTMRRILRDELEYRGKRNLINFTIIRLIIFRIGAH